MQFIETLFELIVRILGSIFKFTFEFLEEIITGIPRSNKKYQAKFSASWELLSSSEKGFCLTGKRNLSVQLSYQNALIVGGTGVGKTSVVLLSSLYSMDSSLIVHDPSSELFLKSAGFLKSKGYEVKVLNFANPLKSSGYNPLVRAKNSSDIQKIASILVSTSLGANSKEPFWNLQAISLLSMLIGILKKQEIQYQNLHNVRLLLNHLGGSPEKVDALFSKYADSALFSEYKSFLSYDDKIQTGIVASCKAALNMFSNEDVAKITSFDDLDLEGFRTKPTVLFIQNSVAEQKYYSPLTSLLFEQFFSYVLGRIPEKGEQDIFLLIDEASSLNLPTLPLAVANIRKHKCGAIILIQSFNQIIHNYGKYDAEGIKSNCYSQMYFTGQGLETTKDLEQTLGQFQYEDKNGKTTVHPLMTNNEIRTMKTNEALLVCGNQHPIRAKLTPYFRHWKYKNYPLIPPPLIESTVPEAIPILTLPNPNEEAKNK